MVLHTVWFDNDDDDDADPGVTGMVWHWWGVTVMMMTMILVDIWHGVTHGAVWQCTAGDLGPTFVEPTPAGCTKNCTCPNKNKYIQNLKSKSCASAIFQSSKLSYAQKKCTSTQNWTIIHLWPLDSTPTQGWYENRGEPKMVSPGPGPKHHATDLSIIWVVVDQTTRL